MEPDALRQSLGVFTSLGMISTTAEAAAVVLAAHFLFHIPVATAILFGFVLMNVDFNIRLLEKF